MNRKLLIIVGSILIALYLIWGVSLPLNHAGVFILRKRIERIIAAAIIAYCTSVATHYFQIITENRILTPSILGFDRLYILIQLIVSLGLKITLPSSVHFFATFVTMTTVGTLLYQWLFKKLHGDFVRLLLIGVMLGSLVQGIVSTIQLMMDPNEFSIFQGLSLASLSDINTSKIILCLISMLVLHAIKYQLDKSLDIVALGKDWAINYGVDMKKYQRASLILISAYISIVTALMGPNVFLGLVCVSIARQFSKEYSNSSIMSDSTWVAISILIGSQLVFERVLHFNGSIGSVITCLGGLFFCLGMKKEVKHDSVG